jgi:kexin
MAVLRALFRRLPIVLLVAFRAVTATGATPAKRSYSTHDYYVLQLDRSAPASIHDCASALGVEVVEQVGELRDHWLVRVPSYNEFAKRSDLDSSSPADAVLERFQAIRRSTASSYSSSLSLVSRSLRDGQRISRSIRSLERQIPRQRTKKRAPMPELPSYPLTPHEDPRAPVPPGGKSQRIAQELGIIDPIFNDQWHLANNPRPNFDLNISGVWKSGIIGKGVYVAVVDDGLDLNSDDLRDNFVRLLIRMP